MRLCIEGVDLPGRHCAPADAARTYDNVQVGVQRRRDVIDLVPGDAATARWSFDVNTRVDEDGTVDFGGPFVHGRRGDRFIYLSWVAGDDQGGFTMFRRAKVHLGDIDPALIRQAADRDHVLVGRIRLTDRCGLPLCSRVRDTQIRWRLSTEVDDMAR